MDEGNKMMNFFRAGCALLTSLMSFQVAFAASGTIREIELKGNATEILMDSVMDRNAIQIDYVRDIVQFSIHNATIYPAKMLHAENATFTKVFAYQYSPSLVRVRFSVDQNAELYRNKVKWSVDGKKVIIQFSAPVPVIKADDEKSLLEKITAKADSKPEPKADVKKESVTESTLTTSTSSLGKKPIKLTGARSGPSMLRSFLAILLVVGGLGAILLYLKKRNSGVIQAKKAGNSWLSNLMGQGRKPKAMMEVIATHVLGPKQSLVVMKIRGQQFVLAVTAESIQLITQLDSDETDLDLLEDPKVAASIGKMFGVEKAPIPEKPVIASSASFNSVLKNSSGAGAIIARNAYLDQSGAPSEPQATARPGMPVGGARDQIRKRLEGIQ